MHLDYANFSAESNFAMPIDALWGLAPLKYRLVKPIGFRIQARSFDIKRQTFSALEDCHTSHIQVNLSAATMIEQTL